MPHRLSDDTIEGSANNSSVATDASVDGYESASDTVDLDPQYLQCLGSRSVADHRVRFRVMKGSDATSAGLRWVMY